MQGPTSAGKTSVIEYLAARTGHHCVRINNHEHTDVQEYVGGYVTNDQVIVVHFIVTHSPILFKLPHPRRVAPYYTYYPSISSLTNTSYCIHHPTAPPPIALGHLEFRDGLLVEALRHGHWIILDELNLAPSDVLEALNRLLDDNKELLIPETGETVRPVDGFCLFATQNPPGSLPRQVTTSFCKVYLVLL